MVGLVDVGSLDSERSENNVCFSTSAWIHKVDENITLNQFNYQYNWNVNGFFFVDCVKNDTKGRHFDWWPSFDRGGIWLSIIPLYLLSHINSMSVTSKWLFAWDFIVWLITKLSNQTLVKRRRKRWVKEFEGRALTRNWFRRNVKWNGWMQLCVE